MKLLILLAAVLITTTANAQISPEKSLELSGNSVSITVKPQIVHNSVLLSWNISLSDVDATWLVQATEDGVNFKTIGYVWGAQNRESGLCLYKDGVSKRSGKFVAYQVVKEKSTVKS